MTTDGVEAGYFTDITYVRQFCAELAPTLLRATAALAGCPPPPADDFEYAELGCGFGDTLATLAAAYPRARFTGVDLGAEHVAGARALAAQGAVGNVRFLERDIEEMAAEDLAPLDYLCAHGLLSWIPRARRRPLFAFAASRLKPGGLLYLGYNALPGWAAVEPLRRLLLDLASGVPGDRASSIRHALAAAKRLRDGGAAYFTENPSAKEILDTLLDRGVPYAAHELFAANWEPAYFVDIAAEAAEHDLRFVGQLPLRLNYRDLGTPAALQQDMHNAANRKDWEHLRAFTNNEFFRRDVYVKGSVSQAHEVARAYLDATPFGTLRPAADVKREIALPGTPLQFTGPAFDAIIAALAGRASTVLELARDPSLATLGTDTLREAVLRLLMGGDVVPMARSSRGIRAPGARSTIASAFNRSVLEKCLEGGRPLVLASPVAGTGVSVSKLDAVVLRALAEPEGDARAAWIRAFVSANPLRLWDHGRSVVEKDEVRALVATQLELFRGTRLAKLVELGIVDDDAPAA